MLYILMAAVGVRGLSNFCRQVKNVAVTYTSLE